MSVRGLARNTGVSTAVYLLGSVSGLVLVPVLLRTLGAAQFGLYVLAQTAVSYSSLIGGGLNRGFVRALAGAAGNDGPQRDRAVVGSGVLAMAVLGLAISALAWVAYPLLTRAFRVPGGSAAAFGWILGGAVTAYALNLLAAPYQGLLVARERLDLVKTIEGASIVVTTVAAAVAASAGRGLPGIAVVMSVVAGLSLTSVLAAAFRVDRSVAMARPRLDRGALAGLWRYGARIQLVWLAGMVNRSIDRVSLGVLRSPAAVAAYDVGDRAAFSLVYTANPLADALAPRMARCLASDDVDGARATYIAATRAFALAACTLGAFAVINGDGLLRAWLGTPDPVSGPALALLAAGYTVGVSFSAANVVATAQAVPTLAMRYSLGMASVNVVLSFAGAALAGVPGAAAGSALSGGCGAVAYALLAERTILGLDRAEGARTVLRSALVAVPVAVLVGLPMRLVSSAAPARPVAFLALGLALLAQIALTLAAAVALGVLPREQLRRLFNRGSRAAESDVEAADEPELKSSEA